MLDKQLIINTNSSETRIALLEKGRVAELYVERNREASIVGNIYKGKVIRVLPGMQCAFVNIGLERSAFLYGGDVIDPSSQANRPDSGSMTDSDDMDPRTQKQSKTPIEKCLKEGQEITVQVSKEPLGTKGARVTMLLSIPGRYLVLMPGFQHIGISRRIEKESERQRLKNLILEINPSSFGVIVRTAAKGAHLNHLRKDLRYLAQLWKDLESRIQKKGSPSLLHKDLHIIEKSTRDLYSDEIKQIVIDHEKSHAYLKRFLTATIPGASKKLRLYTDPTPIFDVYGIEMDIGGALNKKVELPSGGYLIIDQTEALTSFDVNTGRFVGQVSAQETILRTNLEAVVQLVAQLRIRNIGGIIVIDFIDMNSSKDREQVYQTLQEELKKDKSRTNVLKISELGLVQMTRKRTADSLERQLMEPCPHCRGRGQVRSPITEALDLLREIERRYLQTGRRKIKVRVRDDIRDWILEEEGALLDELKKKHGIKVEFIVSEVTLHHLAEDSYEVLPQP